MKRDATIKFLRCIEFWSVNILFYYFLFTSVVSTALSSLNVTYQSQESEGSYKPASIKEVHSNLHSIQALLCTLTATHLTMIHICLHIHSAECTVRLQLLNQAGRNNYPYNLKFVGNTGNPLLQFLQFD